MREGRPDTDAVRLYREFVGAVWGLYCVPQTVHKSVWVAVLAHHHSNHFVEMLAAWLNEMDVQQHLVDPGVGASTTNPALHTGGNGGGDGSSSCAAMAGSDGPHASSDGGGGADATVSGSADRDDAGVHDAASGSYRSLFIAKIEELRVRWASDIAATAASAEAAAAARRVQQRPRTSEVMERVLATHPTLG
eukprot:356375-Chlamydomonas_euryale.AAC.1